MKNKVTKKYFVLIICIALPFLAGFIGSFFTASQTQTEWYETIKPSITPPSWVFPVVWNILFLLIGLSLYLSWTNAKKKDKWKIGTIFGLNLFLNALWSYLYFGLQNPGFAFVDLIVLWITIIGMIFVAGKVSRKAGWLLVPYLIWVSFAGVLNWLSI